MYLTGPEITTVNLLNTKGDVVDTFSLKPGPDQKIKIDGKDTKFSDLTCRREDLLLGLRRPPGSSELPGATENVLGRGAAPAGNALIR